MLADVLFLLFALGLLMGAWAVILARNPMHGVMGMIFAFVNAAGIFILMGAEFLGLLLIMVYVGAIAVMFLFVLMTVDIDYARLKEGFAPYLPVGMLVALALLAELLVAASAAPTQGMGTPISSGGAEQPQNIVQLGQVFFTVYALPFQVAGLILLTAMVGAIVLTHRKRGGVRRQNIGKQVYRDAKASMQLTQPKTGAGASASHWKPFKAD